METLLTPAALVALVGGYLLGAVPFGLVLTRLAGYGDIRRIGSGNIGATNVLRTGNKPLAATVLVLDAGKGGAAALLAAALAPAETAHAAALVAGTAAVLGHNFPVWIGFHGGKGVATTLGTLTAVAWPVGLGACATWLVVAAIFRISSAAALGALTLAPVYALLLDRPGVAVAAAVLAGLAWLRHHENIRRILAGTEPHIGGSKTSG